MDSSTKSWFYMMLPIEPICEVVGEDNIYIYTFPLLGDPMESAKGLEAYIDEVLSKTGAEKVNLTAVFPERTWLFSGQHHEIGRNDVALRLAGCIISGKADNINTTELFPQFNGARNTRALVRPSGYIAKAETLLKTETDKSSEKYINLETAYNGAVKLLNNTICNQAEANEAIRSLENALSLYGVIEAPAEEKSDNFFGFSVLKIFSDVLYVLFKGNGFFEKL